MMRPSTCTGSSLGADVGTPSPSTDRVLFVSHTANASGAEISMLATAASLQRTGWEAQVLAPGPGRLEELCARMGVKSTRAQVGPVEFRRPVRFLQTAGRLRRVLRDSGAAVLHANSLAAGKMVVGLKACSRIPILATVRDIIPLTAPTLWALAALDAVICCSRATAASLRRGYPRHGLRKLHVIYDPVDAALFESAEPDRQILALARGRPVIACISQIVRWKGQHVLLRALKRVAAEGLDFLALLVGHRDFAEPDFDREVQTLAGSPELAQRVRLLDFTARIPELLAAADIVAVPSIAPDPLPRVVQEGMASGSLVIASATGGIPEAVEHGVSGLLVPPGDPDALAKVLTVALRRPEMGRRLGAEARKVVQSRFSPERHASQVTGLYQELVSRRCGRWSEDWRPR